MFEVNFEKTRHFAGEDAAPFQVRLKEQDDGLWKWEIVETKADAEIEEVVRSPQRGLDNRTNHGRELAEQITS